MLRGERTNPPDQHSKNPWYSPESCRNLCQGTGQNHGLSIQLCWRYVRDAVCQQLAEAVSKRSTVAKDWRRADLPAPESTQLPIPSKSKFRFRYLQRLLYLYTPSNS